MAVDGGFSSRELWQAIKPLAATNLVSNPSFEVSTSGWTATSGAITRVAGGKFGAWCGRLLASATNGRASVSLGTLAVSTQVVASVWVKADSASVILRLTLGAVTFDQAHPGDGLWHRLEIAGTTVGSVACTAEVRDTRSSAWTNVDIDGAMAETGRLVATTYIDGDQDGCVWNGTAGLSTSTRDGRDGRGGAIVSLQSLGFYNTQILGIGAPPVDVESQEPAISDGELFQRTRSKPRVLTLIGVIFGNGGMAALHTIRRGLMDVFRPDARSNRGPIMLRYSGSAVTKLLPAYYQGGLEMDGIEAADEKIPLRVTAPDSDFVAETDDQLALSGAQNVTVDRIAHRDSNGVWSGLGTGIPSMPVAQEVYDAVKLPDGRLVVAGDFANAGGVAAADYLGVWDGTAWAALGGSVFGAAVTSLLVTPAGELWVGGLFTNANGDANQDYIAVYNIAAGTWSARGTGANAYVIALAQDPVTGYVWATGSFTSIGGTSSNGIAYWNGSAWVDGRFGAASGDLRDHGITAGPDGRLYRVTSNSVEVNTGAAWVSIGTVSPVGIPSVARLFSDGTYLYAYGGINVIGGVTVGKIARWNGSAWQGLGAGASATNLNAMALNPDKSLIVSGQSWTSIGGIVPPDYIAEWNGSSWLPFSANPPDTGTHANDIYKVFGHPDGSLTVAWSASTGTFGTTLTAPSQTTVTNQGSALAYPVITIASTSMIYSIVNRTTGQAIRFNGLSGATYGMVTLDLRAGRKTVRGQGNTNMLPFVLAGSDLATFCLVPGDNLIEVYAAGTVTAAIRWRARYWSAD